MKTRLLLPNRCKLPGWLLLAAGTALGIALFTTNFEFTFPFLELPENTERLSIWGSGNMTDELVALLVIVGGLLVAFSREKEEDEYVNRLRLESFMWSTLITYIAIGLSFIFIYGDTFLYAMIVLPFLLLYIFIIRFHVILYRNKHQKYEK
jgi:hypothetical protein